MCPGRPPGSNLQFNLFIILTKQAGPLAVPLLAGESSFIELGVARVVCRGLEFSYVTSIAFSGPGGHMWELLHGDTDMMVDVSRCIYLGT